MTKPSTNFLILFFSLAYLCSTQTILEASALQPFMYTDQITGILQPLRPSRLGSSQSFHLPVDTYQIGMVKTKLQLLPTGFPKTQVLAYASKVNGQWKPQYPGPFIQAFSDTPCYVIYTNDIEGKHFLPVDYSPPFEMIFPLRNEVPTVPHLHGLETQMGSDGEPMAYWTRSGARGEVYFTLKSKTLKKNDAIYRYYNTKEGLYWYHDHTMAMTRLNVYAGLAGLYEIINPKISSEESNILRIYGNVERRHFAISDKTFNTDGSLNYPNTTFFPDFTSWVPGFSGVTNMVNGKVWPKLTVQPKIYRFSLLNACQGKFLNVYFETSNGTKLDFQLFRRDSDFTKNAIKTKELLLLNGGRVEIFVDFSKVTGSVFFRTNAPFPFPGGAPPNEFATQIMRIDVKTRGRNLQQVYGVKVGGSSSSSSSTQAQTPASISETPSVSFSTSSAESSTLSTNTFIDSINRKTAYYQATPVDMTLDYIDQPQAPKMYLATANGSATTISARASEVPSAPTTISLVDALKNSSFSNPQPNQIVTSPTLTFSAAQTAANIVRTSSTSPMGNTKSVTDTKISLAEFLSTLKTSPLFNANYWNNFKPNNSISITNVPYPRFPEGKQFVTVLMTANNAAGQLSGFFMDGVPVEHGCDGAFFRQGETYDFYIVNIMPNDHPIHIHLANFQIIHRFAFNITSYQEEWNKVNGVVPARGYAKAPKQIDPRPFRTGALIPPDEKEKLFMDVIEAKPEMVTVARFKIANHKGERFPFQISGMRYVYHCHILEHEDNEMMRYFCIE